MRHAFSISRYRPEANPLVYDWGFPRGRTERYEPFFQMVNGYNGRTAFSLRFGVYRLVCRNGLIVQDSIRLTSVAHDHRAMVASIETAMKAADFRRQADRLKAEFGRLWRVLVPREQFGPVIHAVLGIRGPVRMDERAHRAWGKLQRVVNENSDHYVAELGSTAYALMAVLTDLATRPPGERPFLFRQRHSLQRLAGLWAGDFVRKADEPGFDLAEYIRDLTANERSG